MVGADRAAFQRASLVFRSCEIEVNRADLPQDDCHQSEFQAAFACDQSEHAAILRVSRCTGWPDHVFSTVGDR